MRAAPSPIPRHVLGLLGLDRGSGSGTPSTATANDQAPDRARRLSTDRDGFAVPTLNASSAPLRRPMARRASSPGSSPTKQRRGGSLASATETDDAVGAGVSGKAVAGGDGVGATDQRLPVARAGALPNNAPVVNAAFEALYRESPLPFHIQSTPSSHKPADTTVAAAPDSRPAPPSTTMSGTPLVSFASFSSDYSPEIGGHRASELFSPSSEVARSDANGGLTSEGEDEISGVTNIQQVGPAPAYRTGTTREPAPRSGGAAKKATRGDQRRVSHHKSGDSGAVPAKKLAKRRSSAATDDGDSVDAGPRDSSIAELTGGDDQREGVRLRDWYLRRTPKKELFPLNVGVEGMLVPANDGSTSTAQLYHSSTIVGRTSATQLATASGNSYILVGTINAPEMARQGFPESIAAAFSSGFPDDWKEVLRAPEEAPATTRAPDAEVFAPPPPGKPKTPLRSDGDVAVPLDNSSAPKRTSKHASSATPGSAGRRKRADFVEVEPTWKKPQATPSSSAEKVEQAKRTKRRRRATKAQTSAQEQSEEEADGVRSARDAVPGLTRTRSGRRSLPPLEFWRGQKEVRGEDGTTVGILAGSFYEDETTRTSPAGQGGASTPSLDVETLSSSGILAGGLVEDAPVRMISMGVRVGPKKSATEKKNRHSGGARQTVLTFAKQSAGAKENDAGSASRKRSAPGKDSGAPGKRAKVAKPSTVGKTQADDDICRVCDRGDKADSMLLCDGCDSGYHMGCLTPPLASIPDGDWFCQDCATHDSQRQSRTAAQNARALIAAVTAPTSSSSEAATPVAPSERPRVRFLGDYAARESPVSSPRWSEEQLQQLAEAVNVIPPNTPNFWSKVAKQVGRPDFECSLQLRKLFATPPAVRTRRGRSKKQAAAPTSEDVGSWLADTYGDGTDDAPRAAADQQTFFKRVRDARKLRQIIADVERLHSDDPLATPRFDRADGAALTKKSPSAAAWDAWLGSESDSDSEVSSDSPSDGDQDEESSVSRRRKKRELRKHEILLATSARTPGKSPAGDGLLRGVNREDFDGYISKFRKRSHRADADRRRLEVVNGSQTSHDHVADLVQQTHGVSSADLQELRDLREEEELAEARARQASDDEFSEDEFMED